ncbi:MAG TPA: glycosyl hydrolase family 28-related protein [Candidatus Krumholzibacteria bacterium]|nr:glycosyl hydrolase family 28-related protein [Candidatus Krumholzibacteria bacterium]
MKFLRHAFSAPPSLTAIVTAVFCWPGPVHSGSFYPLRPDDARAVDFTKAAFGAHADGVGDDADALQRAIDQVQETTGAGVLLIPEGRYRLGRTVHVWQGIRLLGYGTARPVFVLGKDTPGFQEGSGRYMVHFADNRPDPGQPIVDATEFTFFSGMSNIDFELQDGNPAAIAVRFHVAQHSELTHMNFRVGTARAAVEDIGNQASDIHVEGGEYGIITRRTAPVWQFLLMDSSFDGQRAAAIHTQEAGFTLIRVSFSNMPVALQIAPGEVEQLYGRDLWMRNIRTAAFVAGNARNAHSAVTLVNTACSDVPRFFAGENPLAAPGRHYVVDRFTQGLMIGADGREQGIATRHTARSLDRPAQPVPTDIPATPAMDQWVNVRSLGAKGDGQTDDTDALLAGIEKHAALFFPSGTYRVSRPLMLEPETVLIGLNPATTQIALLDSSPAFAGEGDPVGIVVAPQGGRNIVRALGVTTDTSNPRAAGVIWMAGTRSLLDDVSFPGQRFFGSGFRGFGPPRRPPSSATTAPVVRPRFEFSPAAADLLVTKGGGGIFRNNWPHGSNARIGLRVENTATPGKIYQMSVEHHFRVEAEFRKVRNWEMYAFQTEEENPAGANAYAIDIEDSSSLLFANTYMYRVSRNVVPKTYAIRTRRSDHIAFENMKVFSQTRLAFDNAVYDEANGAYVRPHVFTHFAVNAGAKPRRDQALRGSLFGSATLQMLANGFSNASGLAVDDTGTPFFTDAAHGKIYRWNAAKRTAEVLAQIEGQPQVLGFVAPDTLLAIANERAVYRLSSTAPGPAERVAETAEPSSQTTLLLPVGIHNSFSVMQDLMERRGYVYRPRSNTAVVSAVSNEHRGYFYAPGNRTAIMAGGTWRPLLQSSQLAAFVPGTSHYLASEDDGRTWRVTLQDDGKLTGTVFAERGGTSVVTDAAGNVYIAEGEIRLYDRHGKPLGVLEIPERPGSLAFGGADRRTLYVAARTSLYSIRTKSPGR